MPFACDFFFLVLLFLGFYLNPMFQCLFWYARVYPPALRNPRNTKYTLLLNLMRFVPIFFVCVR